jgi:TRAP-type transport system periplasmic protein
MKKVLSLCLCACFLFALVSIIGGPVSAEEKVITLKFTCQFPSMHKVALLKAEWCKEVEKRTKGRVKVDFYPGAILTPPAQTYDSIMKGIADVGESFASYTKGRFPLMEVIDLPLGYKSGSQSTKLTNDFYKKFKPKEFDNVQVMFFHTAGPQDICTKKPVNKMEDLKGMKIRATGTSAQIIMSLGAAPVGMSMGEAYDAIARGVANGVVCPVEATKGWKLADVVSSCTIHNSRHTNVAYVVMNKKKWNALPKDVQQIIEKINEEYVEKQGKLWDELDKEALDFFAQKGGKMITVSKEEDGKFKKALQPMLDEYVKAMSAKGLPGAEALKFCQDYLHNR